MTDTIDDVVIVGAGASGAAVAWRLARAGLKVTCLEQGDWVRYDEVPSFRTDWEVARQTSHHPNPNVRRNPVDYPVDDSEAAIKPFLYNAVGGSTILWGAHFPRFRPSDFRVKTLDGVGDDWPISYEDLAPYYEENDRMMGVSGLAGDPGNPPRLARQMPPLPLGRGGEKMAAAFDRLGWHWWPCDVAINSQPYGEGRGGCNNCGPCDLGCPSGARSSSDVTYWPQAIRAGVELRTRCRVREITTNEHGMASGAIYYDAEGKEQFQPAEVVILACNGVGTPRLLLNSASARFPDGLANSSGLVGRNLMLHPWPQVRGYVEDETDAERGPMTTIWSKQFYETDPARGFVRGYTLQFARGTGPVNEAITSSAAGALPWGRGHHRAFREIFGHRLQIGIACEDLPEEHNAVTLDPVLKDSHGIPAPRIDYTISENTARMMEHGIARASEILEAAGARNLYTSRTLLNSPGHLLGTCRLGEDPERSVVNAWGRSHDVKNLFIVDGSIWVTSGGVNPTSTIQALALYIADQMKRRLATLFD
jgi:choline dehydrogenase-like flavoprotein